MPPSIISSGSEDETEVYDDRYDEDGDDDQDSPVESSSNWRAQAVQRMDPIPPHRPNQLYTIKAYRFRASRGRWKHVPMPSDDEIEDLKEMDHRKHPSAVRIITWNIDFMSANQGERLFAALRHIERDVLRCRGGDGPAAPCVILLQEVHADVFPLISADVWVRRHFQVTPSSSGKWPEGYHYGNVTLVSRDITLVKCQILHYGNSTQGRTALAAYILMREPAPADEIVTMCIVNTHLESLTPGFYKRPGQLRLASAFLKRECVRGGVVAGDMNPTESADGNIDLDLGLRDAWRKSDKDKSGFTWGLQERAPSQFPPARFDKMFYLPRRGYKIDHPERIGVGMKTVDDEWVSDHYGLDSTLRLVAQRRRTQRGL